jgi:hypothetical protein
MTIFKDQYHQYPLQFKDQYPLQFKDQYPLQLYAQARTALLEWYAKELKDEELAEKVRRVMKAQFGVEDKEARTTLVFIEGRIESVNDRAGRPKKHNEIVANDFPCSAARPKRLSKSRWSDRAHLEPRRAPEQVRGR